MATVNITVKVEEEIKRNFDDFCENVGINATAAVNMFIRTVLHTRELPFKVTDTNEQKKLLYGAQAMKSIKNMRDTSTLNGNSEMTLEEINMEIEAARKEASK